MYKGEKVVLRALEISDLDEIMKYWNNIDLRRELGEVIPHSKDQQKEWIEKCWKEAEEGKTYTFAIVEKESGKFLGICSLNNVRHINRSAKVSIAIYDKNQRGKGFGTDAMKILLKIGFDFLNLHRIALNVFETNKAAIRVYEKVGFKKVGLHRETDFVDGRYVNDVAMDILENEWREKK
ncbi:MAG: GNAT family N-acetyltransferase [Candidatus Heimdallarchaeum endolithica]|uniref:GNAT family N-acetyltransferase n=1 Tax=Candidatus Heimdallarchaeum endolithica TaxID=2876572 RepID=A0A9Y1FPB5_9ARCH|nr:MAG: GNAT family N-acetyltransferase [Candidatus Heimdallarchaeum endolithica]